MVPTEETGNKNTLQSTRVVNTATINSDDSDDTGEDIDTKEENDAKEDDGDDTGKEIDAEKENDAEEDDGDNTYTADSSIEDSL